MDIGKIKNHIILILAIMNAFLLVIVISNQHSRAQSRAAQTHALQEILDSRAITLADGVEFIENRPVQITLKRNLKDEARMLTSLIGRTTTYDKGGNIYYYAGASGKAQFRSTGDFELSFDSNSITAGADPIKTAVSILGKMNISSASEDAVVTQDGSGISVTQSCTYKGTTVFNTHVTCHFSNGSLAVIEGRRLLDDVESKTTPDEYPDIAEIIINFLNYIESSGKVYNQLEITAIDTGYFAESKDVNSFLLLPVWRISTDMGVYYFDAITGQVTSIL